MGIAATSIVSAPAFCFAIKVRSRSEDVVSRSLQAKGYKCLLPTYPERRRYADRIKEVQSPLFPGYVFSWFDPQYRLPIITTPLVQEVVSFGRIPCPVNEEEIQAIQKVVDSGFLAKPCPYLRIGQRVRIQEGPLAGVEGVFSREKGDSRLIVSVHLLQRSVSVELDRHSVRPLYS
jgi:transcription antitermination factor NusG